MAEDDDEDSKTEDPTEKKLRDAMEKGNVPSSREAPLFATALGFYLFAVFFMPLRYYRLRSRIGSPGTPIDGCRAIATLPNSIASSRIPSRPAGAMSPGA